MPLQSSSQIGEIFKVYSGRVRYGGNGSVTSSWQSVYHMEPEAKVVKCPWEKSFASLYRGSDFGKMRKKLMANKERTG